MSETQYTIKKVESGSREFVPICDYLEQNIVPENLRKNGGTLNYSNLTYDSDILLVAFDNEQPVGYNSIVRTTRGFYVYQIAVKKDHQHQGVGTAMMQSVIDMAREANTDVVAHVMDYNEASKGMFNSLGFKKIDEEQKTGNGLYVLKQKRLFARKPR